MSRGRAGMTAIEVLASTILAALLMTALLGVLRGLKAQARLLESRAPEPEWRQALDAILSADLANARTYQATPTSITLSGFGGRTPDGAATWLPATVVYAIAGDDRQTWLIRRELPTIGGEAPAAANLVLAGARQIHLGSAVGELTPSSSRDLPLPDSLVLTILGAEGPIYELRRHAR